jgi:hypothetical protein
LAIARKSLEIMAELIIRRKMAPIKAIGNNKKKGTENPPK